MRDIYKIVSLDQFLQNNKDTRIRWGTKSSHVGLSNQAVMAIEAG